MKTFPHPNMTNFKCRICNTTADAPVVLVPIPGTEDGNIMKAEQIHAECLELFQKMYEMEKQDE